MKILLVLFLFAILNCEGQTTSNINNPVLPGVADAGVIKYNGEYYIGGVFTNGSFYVSKDLIKWEGPTHVFSMANEWTSGPSADDSQIHANDINYINGIFHQFWSVNYWGRDRNAIHIGHATSPDILGPYVEPVKQNWVENRIDPELFVDDDGKVYLYMVKFTDGNTIWARPMKDPWTFSGEPIYLFSSLPNTWETLDNRVEEGPWVIKYRGRYYMMYNANHTSPNWGNYALGVAEADSPLAFNHGNKYPYPLLESNQISFEVAAVDLLKYGGKERGVFQYRFAKPDTNWASANADSTGWLKGKGGFGSTVVRNSTTRKIGTSWTEPQIWLRRSFNVDRKNTRNLMLRINHDGRTRAFLNGRPIYESQSRVYTSWNLDENAMAALKDGENILAVESTGGARSKYLDVSLFDIKNGKGDDILFSPGQPNILPGPNGFEWWLIYMANKNSDRRGQYINRVHFFDKRMYVDGVTSNNTPGHHPPPAAASFSDLFNVTGALQSQWNLNGGIWSINNKELLQTSNSVGKAAIKSFPATHYLFQTGIKIIDTATAKAGLVAWWRDENNWLRIVLNPATRKWAFVIAEKGKQTTASFPLPKDFRFSVYHTLSVYKNGSTFTIKMDDLPLREINTNFTGKGLPALYTEGGKAAFDGVIYTAGWDEYDTKITGWQTTTTTKSTNGWKVSKEGITSPGRQAEDAVFKGDELASYEFSTQVTALKRSGSTGIYAAYSDNNNYLKAMFDFQRQLLIVSGKKDGKERSSHEIPLNGYKDYHADMKYTDFFEKHFTMHTPTFINSIRLNKIPHAKPDTMIDDMYNKMIVSYKVNGKWYPLTNHKDVDSSHPGFHTVSFQPVEVEALKFVNKGPEDQNFYINKIWVNEIFRQSYNIRVTRLKDNFVFFVDGKEVLILKNDFPSSRVGLATENSTANFNGISLFHLPE